MLTVIVSMGSSTDTIEETVNHLNSACKARLVKVRLYRPFSAKHLVEVLPQSVKRIACSTAARSLVP